MGIGWTRLFVPFLLFMCIGARQSSGWDSMFDVPSGFRSYAAQREAGRRVSIDDMSLGFEGFLDEGLEGDVRVPTSLHHKLQPQAEKEEAHHHHHDEHHHHPHSHSSLKSAGSSSHSRDLEQETHHHAHDRHHNLHHHHRHHGHGDVSFLEISGDDPAMAEAQADMLRSQALRELEPSPSSLPLVAQATEPKPDRPFAIRPSAAPSASPQGASVASMLAGQGSALNELFPRDEESASPLKTKDDILSALRVLESAILNRAPSETSLTSSITNAAKTGEIVKIFPRFPLRGGLQPGVLPGLVDSAVTSAAILPSIIGDDLGKNVEAVSELQSNPDAMRQLQAKLPELMPDSPRLHPLSQLRQTTLENEESGVNAPVSLGGPALPSLLETDTSDHHHHHDMNLRKDQAIDLQYLRGIGQGLEVLADLFGAADPNAQRELFEIASTMKSMGSSVEDPAVASLLEVQQLSDNVPNYPPRKDAIASYSVQDETKLLSPSTFAAAPLMAKAAPAPPRDELSWMLEGLQAKGYTSDSGSNPPERLDTQRMLDTIRAFFRKGQQMMDASQGNNAGSEDVNYKNKGFEGWPQPFWWTRPPAWLDDVPSWMQRLQLKKASGLHRSTPYA